MPYSDPDPTDPMTLHGVAVETRDDGAMREMAQCFVEELFRLGFDPDRILRMFEMPEYAGPYLAHQILGEEAIRSLIDDQMSLRGPRRAQVRSAPKAGDRISLPVLES